MGSYGMEKSTNNWTCLAEHRRWPGESTNSGQVTVQSTDSSGNANGLSLRWKEVYEDQRAGSHWELSSRDRFGGRRCLLVD